MKTKKKIAEKAEKIKELEDLTISIEFICPNTGNIVGMTSRESYSSPITYFNEEYQLGDYTWDSYSRIDIDRDCPECGERHFYEL